jgi:hypothetical protein
MPNIFKANIAKEINKALGPLVFPATLTQTRASTRGNVTGGTHPVKTKYPAKGFVDSYEAFRVDGTIIQSGDRKITLLGASVSVAPEVNDSIFIEGRDWLVINVARDPAGATYECQAR